MKLISVVATMVVATVTGCGTVFSGTTQPVSFVGVPPDARLTVDGSDVGTQRQVSLARGKDHFVKVDRPGGCSVIVPRSLNGVAIFNLVNPFGWLIDTMSGALWKLDQSVTVPQECGGGAVSTAPDAR